MTVSHVQNQNFKVIQIFMKKKGQSHQHISVFKVVPPVWPDLPLTSDVPNIQFKPLRLYALNVESLKESENLKLVIHGRQIKTVISKS